MSGLKAPPAVGRARGRPRAAERVADVRQRLAHAVGPADGALSIEAALCVLAIVAARPLVRRAVAVALRILAALWVVLVVGRYADVTARSLYGRDINLYWDLRHMPNVGAMLSFVAKPWLVAATIAGAVLLPLVIYLPLRWALGCVSDATNDPRARHVLAAVAGGVLALGIAQSLDARVPE